METAIVKIESLAARRTLIMSMIAEYASKGFGNCQNVAQLKNELAQINYDKYKDKYPTYLFFSDEQFDEIVKRNNLVISNTEAYTGYIPDNCFEAIINENIDREDLRENKYEVSLTSNLTGGNFSSASFTKDLVDKLLSMDSAEVMNFIGACFIRNNYGKPFNRKPTRHEMNMWYVGKHDINNLKFHINATLVNDRNMEDIFIAAPKIMIDESKRRKTFSFSFFSKKIPKELDPIVFRYVKDGILVITFWK